MVLHMSMVFPTVPMTSKIATRANITAASFAPIGQAFAASAMGIWRLVVAIKHRRELAHLADFDERMLADIGLTRTDLRDAYSEPLWRDPTSMLVRRAGGGHRRSRTDRSELKDAEH
jgi:uncharacterized protein YjiS (DUF1127 family)